MSSPELFDDVKSSQETQAYRPLADRMRPRVAADLMGQTHLLAQGKPLRRALDSGRLHSMIFWGPPGSGKTTLGRMAAEQGDANFLALSAVLSGVKDIRAAIADAQQTRQMAGRDTVLFVDEVHRFNKGQQDAFLPHIEDGSVIFIGATTENPSFELNSALLSRARVYVLKTLGVEDLVGLLRRALGDDVRGLGGSNLQMTDAQLQLLAEVADGDARRALNLLDIVHDLTGQGPVAEDTLEQVVSEGGLRRFDKGGDAFYEQISALHKSIRGSDPDAALYWLCRMLDGGCDPIYAARRLVRIASEDIGNADPRALTLALDAWNVQTRLGSPEGELALAQSAIYMACAAKSNAVYQAYNQAMEDVRDSGSLDVPVHLRNAPTKLMKELGYGKRYRYAHDEPDAYAAGENYFPEDKRPVNYYQPVPRGMEIKIQEKLARLKQLDSAVKNLPKDSDKSS